MKHLIIAVAVVVGSFSFALADDTVVTQVRFKKYLYQCRECGKRISVDKRHTDEALPKWCPFCDKAFVFRCNIPIEFNDSITYEEAKYKDITKEDKDSAKKEKVDAWVYGLENPPAYVEPTKAELEKQKVNLQAELDSIQLKMDAK